MARATSPALRLLRRPLASLLVTIALGVSSCASSRDTLAVGTETQGSSPTTVDHRVLASIDTWTEFVTAASPQRALGCLGQMSLQFNALLAGDGTPEAPVYRITNGDAIVVEGVTQEFEQQDSAKRIIANARAMSNEDWRSDWFDLDAGCIGPSSEVDEALINFGSDATRFGGRGGSAQGRCIASAAIELILDQLTAGVEPVPYVYALDAAIDLMNVYWADRAPDRDFIDIVTELDRAGVLEPGMQINTLSTEQATAVSAARQTLRNYRGSLPEGLILCPLDKGWQP